VWFNFSWDSARGALTGVRSRPGQGGLCHLASSAPSPALLWPNVMTTGNLFYPTDETHGVQTRFAGAVEVCGPLRAVRIMPPVHGGLRPLSWRNTLGVANLTVAKLALAPAILSYVCPFCSGPFEAKRKGIASVPRKRTKFR